MQNRIVRLHQNHDYVSQKKSNTANVRSSGLTIEPPNNTFLVLARHFLGVIKLYKSAGVQIDPNTKVFFSKQRPGDSAPTYAQGVWTLHDYHDLSTKEQRNKENYDTLFQDIGAKFFLREQEKLIIEFEGQDAIDWTVAGTTFEFSMERTSV